MKLNQWCLALVVISLAFSHIILAKDEIKKEPNSKEEIRLEPELKDMEFSGVLSEVITKTGFNYSIQTSDKKIVYLKNKIGDKEIDFEPFKNKQVVAKGKGVHLIGATHLIHLLSIELKAADAEKKSEEKKKDPGNQSKN